MKSCICKRGDEGINKWLKKWKQAEIAYSDELGIAMVAKQAAVWRVGSKLMPSFLGLFGAGVAICVPVTPELPDCLFWVPYVALIVLGISVIAYSVLLVVRFPNQEGARAVIEYRRNENSLSSVMLNSVPRNEDPTNGSEVAGDSASDDGQGRR